MPLGEERGLISRATLAFETLNNIKLLLHDKALRTYKKVAVMWREGGREGREGGEVGKGGEGGKGGGRAGGKGGRGGREGREGGKGGREGREGGREGRQGGKGGREGRVWKVNTVQVVLDFQSHEFTSQFQTRSDTRLHSLVSAGFLM